MSSLSRPKREIKKKKFFDEYTELADNSKETPKKEVTKKNSKSEKTKKRQARSLQNDSDLNTSEKKNFDFKPSKKRLKKSIMQPNSPSLQYMCELTPPKTLSSPENNNNNNKMSISPKADPEEPTDIGRWKATDDILLINNCLHICDLTTIHENVKFSCHFTYEEIRERWHHLLFDPRISKHSKAAINSLPTEVMKIWEAKTEFSDFEDEVLIKMKESETDSKSINPFKEVLFKNTDIFHKSRNPESLRKRWLWMKRLNLLVDQTFRETYKKDDTIHLGYNDVKISDRSSALQNEQKMTSLLQNYMLFQDENEIFSSNEPDIQDCKVLATITNENFEYKMEKNEITFGRKTEEFNVDIDLSMSSACTKISRKQGVIRLEDNGSLTVYNKGLRPIFVDGKLVTKGEYAPLFHRSVIHVQSSHMIVEIPQQNTS